MYIMINGKGENFRIAENTQETRSSVFYREAYIADDIVTATKRSPELLW